MKRFVTYLYECERGNKSKNVGFIRVNVKGEETRFEIFVRNFLCGKDFGKLYVLVYKNELIAIELTEIEITNGKGDGLISVQTNNMLDSGFSINDIIGIGILLDSGIYIVSCWDDAHADEIAMGQFLTERNKRESQLEVGEEAVEPRECEIVEKEICPEVVEENQESDSAPELLHEAHFAIYEKIDLSQIRDLPSPNWHLTTNSFLVHGFFNYGYLVLKKEMETDKKKLSLGIPGFFEKPEAVMAVLFGFPRFEEVPKEMISEPMNQLREFEAKGKNQETEVGTFGCWFVDLKV